MCTPEHVTLFGFVLRLNDKGNHLSRPIGNSKKVTSTIWMVFCATRNIYIMINLEPNAVHCPKYYSFLVTVTMVWSMPTQYMKVELRKGYRKENVGPRW